MDTYIIAGVMLGIVTVLPILMVCHMAADWGRYIGIVHKADDDDDDDDDGEN